MSYFASKTNIVQRMRYPFKLIIIFCLGITSACSPNLNVQSGIIRPIEVENSPANPVVNIPSINPQLTHYLDDPIPSGRIFTVCPLGCDYNLPSQVLSSSNGLISDGDTVEIRGGDYVDCAVITNNNIIIKGIAVSGVIPHLRDKTCARKGILVIGGNHVLIDNLELSGSRDTGFGDNNWAGVRIDSGKGNNVTIRRAFIHDNDNGVLGGGGVDGVELIENSRFERNGMLGFAHGIYAGTMRSFVLRNSVVINNAHDSHLVKTRALNNVIECNQIASLNGLNSDAIDVPQAGATVIRKNVIESGPNVVNSRAIIAYGEESGDNPIKMLSLQNNIIIDDRPMQFIFYLLQSPVLSGWLGNVVISSSQSLFHTDSAKISTGILSMPNRAGYSLPPYDSTTSSLPLTPVCN